jgi:hypothetical protein
MPLCLHAYCHMAFSHATEHALTFIKCSYGNDASVRKQLVLKIRAMVEERSTYILENVMVKFFFFFFLYLKKAIYNKRHQRCRNTMYNILSNVVFREFFRNV